MHSGDAPAGVAFFFFLAIGAVALFTFLSVAAWAGTRQAEREAYYNAEMMKKIAESGGGAGNPALEYLREREQLKLAKQRGGFKLGGLINIAVGLGMMVFLRALIHGAPIFLAGTIPLFIGLALLAYAFWSAPQERA
jgi:hypothetical protein